MNAAISKLVRSPSYPSLSLKDAIAAVRRIEARYRSSPVDRTDAAKLIGYAALSGPANQALASLASYGLVDRAGKGLMRVTPRAVAILHPNNEAEFKEGLRAAALEPQLFQELQERFQDVDVPPEEGVVSYLNRQGFNQSAIRPAARAFLETARYLQEAGVSESHGPKDPADQNSDPPADESGRKFGGAKVGDLVQWESQGALRLEKPLRVRFVSEDGKWVAVEGSPTGIPMSEVIVQEKGGGAVLPPVFPLEEDRQVAGTDLRFKLGKGVVVKVTSPDELGAEELGRLVKLLEAQKIALAE